MRSRAKSLVLALILLAGFANGAPLSAALQFGGKKSCKMKCCKKKMHAMNHKAKNFCLVTGCDVVIPAMPGSSSDRQFDSPNVVQIERPFSTGVRLGVENRFLSYDSRGKPDFANPPPKYLLHNSLLI